MSTVRGTGLPRKRKFGKAWYSYRAARTSKKDAQNIAKNTRKNGGRARVVKDRATSGQKIYVVYSK